MKGRLTTSAGAQALIAAAILLVLASSPMAQSPLTAGPLVIRDFTLRFDPSGTFALSGAGWPEMNGAWTVTGTEISVQMAAGPDGCTGPGRYTYAVNGAAVTFAVVIDACEPRRMILDRSSWLPAGTKVARPERRITHTAVSSSPLPGASPAAGSWPSFRGPVASGVAEDQHLPDSWNPATGQGVLWRTTIPGLAHSSPVVWGDLVFVTSAISSQEQRHFQARSVR